MAARHFNTAGPVRPDQHYCVPLLNRWDLGEVVELIDQQKYFVLHAPRQTGKTSCLHALMRHLNTEGRYRCLYANVEVGQSAREEVGTAMRAILAEIADRAEFHLGDTFFSDRREGWTRQAGDHHALIAALSEWCRASAKPVVLLIDEIDALVGDTLIAVLRQLRAGYDRRPESFPQTVVLCGVRDVRDYRIHSDRDKAIITGGSAFNIKTASLRLGNFTESDVRELYAQHTAETGQRFESEALAAVWHLTQGQPWLVNALGHETCWRMKTNRDRTRTITDEMVYEAKENLIAERVTHLDQLADKLQEDRVRRVVEPILAGDTSPDLIPPDDVSYVRDLGLITTEGQLAIANPIYREVIPRELTYSTQLTISQEPSWYVQADGRLDLPKLLAAFQEFFREHSEHWVERFDYKEAGPQLLMQAFLQRIVNSDGRVEREYGLGRMRTDLLVVWPHPGGVQKAVIELKLLRRSLAETIASGLAQTVEYMSRCGTEEGHLIVFNRDVDTSWDDKLFRRQEQHDGRSVTVWGM